MSCRREGRRLDDVADIEQADPGDAVERGDQRGIAQLSLGVFDGGFIVLDLRGELIHGRLLIVAHLARGGILLRSSL